MIENQQLMDSFLDPLDTSLFLTYTSPIREPIGGRGDVKEVGRILRENFVGQSESWTTDPRIELPSDI